MAITAKPEVLPPPRQGWAGKMRDKAGNNVFDNEHLDLLSHLLDDFIRIPGTPIRFGLDGIVGFIPGIGDILGGLASTIIIVAAWVRGVPPITIARMVMNVAIETVVGSVPVFGNLFDIGWRANRRNYKLLAGSVAGPAEARRHSMTSWTIFAVLGVFLVSLMLIPELLVVWLLMHLRSR
jgi:Domain of unknown function (DUF4112)